MLFNPTLTTRDHLLLQWLTSAQELEKIDILYARQQELHVRCGDTLQAFRLWDRLEILKSSGCNRIVLYVGGSLFGDFELSRLD